MSKDRTAEVKAAQENIDLEKNRYQIRLETTLGDITLGMMPEVAPGHVKNMVALAQIGFYDGIIFHRVIDGFMIQAGCPEGRGTGGPGYRIAAEFNAVPHEPGVLSMARSSDPDSAGSQFFICLERVPHLDRQYTAFGRTADAASMDVVRKIGAEPTGPQDRPKRNIEIKKATVLTQPK